MSSETTIRVEGVTVRYGRTTAVDEVSLSVPEGSVCALLGRNGAGKSSLIRCILGHRRPDAGRITLFGEDVWQRRAALMARVGVVPESPDAPPDLTVDQIAAVLASVHARWNRATLDERLGRFAIPRGVPFGRLSRGQKAQVELSLALATDSELLILDDPTLGLDPVARRSILEELVDELAGGGRTILITTHDLAGIEGIADRVAFLKEGRLLIDESLEALKGRFRLIRWQEGEDPTRGLEVLRRSDEPWGHEAVVGDFPEGWVRGGCEVVSLSLEEIFVALCGEEKGSDA